jgi:AMME syndrome candidate gene 1 protein
MGFFLVSFSVSLLTDFEDAPTYLDWTIGIHGIYITFPNPYQSYSGRSYFRRRASERSKLSATYLPDVIPEQGWTKYEAVESAIRKAGWDGGIDNDLLESIKLRRYQSRKVVVSWAEYLKWKDRPRPDAADEHFETF